MIDTIKQRLKENLDNGTLIENRIQNCLKENWTITKDYQLSNYVFSSPSKWSRFSLSFLQADRLSRSIQQEIENCVNKKIENKAVVLPSLCDIVEE